MKLIDYQIRITGLKAKAGSIPVALLQDIIEALLKGCDRVLRLVVEGRSTKIGKTPDWLKDSLNFTITGLTTGSTVLELETPILGDSMPDQFSMKKLWDDRELMKPNDTPLTLLNRSISDAASENMESDYIDAGVLDALLSFKSVTKGSQELWIDSKSRKKDKFKISGEEIKKIRKIQIETPKPQTIAVSGLFNLIEHSNRRFQLKLPDGKSLHGIMDSSLVDLEEMRELWGKRVTVKGKAHYKPSGKLRSIEAVSVRPFEEGDEILQTFPRSQKRLTLFNDFIAEKNANKSLKKIWGKWPGDESITELLTALAGEPH